MSLDGAAGSAGLAALIRPIFDSVLPKQEQLAFTVWGIVGAYVLKGIGRRELLAAVRAVRAGGSVLEPALLRSLAAPAPREAADAPGGEPLTRVELEALALLAAGLTNREIAERLRWSVGTVKKYVQRILEKLDVSDRTQAAVVAVRRGLLE